MKLVIGLGNPEKKYEKTRHNIGFRIVDEFARHNSVTFQTKDRFKAHIAEFNLGREKVVLVKPTTYYNLSGEAVRALVDFYKIDNDDILVVHDDIALPFGSLRTRVSGSDAGNNGMKSIIEHFGPDIKRIRVGTSNDKLGRVETANFVLGKFTLKETLSLKEIFKKTTRIIERFIDGQFDAATL